MLGNLNDTDLRMLRTFCAIIEAGGLNDTKKTMNTNLTSM
ncbi:LysR family transcriptional regulator, partial [Pseudomonas aeruginosa]